ncbi:MAG: hypothetical protein JXI43_14580 [Tissierellales bacterium]|nr:hypothetical protein [Tissierellales bacterium]
MQNIQLIWGLIRVFVIPCIVYIVLISKFIRMLFRNARGKTVQPSQTENHPRGGYPFFRTVGAYIGAIWITTLMGVSTFILAIHRLHAIEKFEYGSTAILQFLPYSLILIVILQKLATILASKRQERPFYPTLPIKVYIFGILTSILIFFIFQKQNPLTRYGVEFEWYDPADEPGQYHLVHLIRHIHGQTISGPLCGGQYPRITFTDYNQDHREEVVIATKQGQELGIIEVIEPYVPEQPAFKIIRGKSYLPDTFDLPADYLKVTF